EFPSFLRHYLNSQTELVTKHALFKSIRKAVRTDDQVLGLLDELEKYAYTYNALFNAEDDLWQNDREVKECVNALKLFRVTLCHPLLLVAFDKLSFDEFRSTMRIVVNISFRYNVIGRLQTNEMERAYNKTAVSVKRGELTRGSAIAENLSSIYLSDDEFRSYFELKRFNTSSKKIARYILYKIESQMPGGKKADYQLDDGTLEHILPESMTDDWRKLFTEEEHESSGYMLGNLTLLEPKLNNKEAAQHSFSKKKEVYAKSQYALSNTIGGAEWSVQMIKHRQAGLAKTAAGIWKI
ncbi:MAG: HNH endonuclease family protein, partial [Flavobacteriales bacterium]